MNVIEIVGWKAFISSLPEDECRIAIYNWKIGKSFHTLFVLWIPEKASKQSRLMYAASKDHSLGNNWGLRNYLHGWIRLENKEEAENPEEICRNLISGRLRCVDTE